MVEKLEKLFTFIISCLLLTFIFFVLNKLINGDIKQEKDIVIYILGATTGALTTIIQYWLGSSSGSQKKNDIINNLKQ